MKEIFDYCKAFRYGTEIGDPQFVHRAEAFTMQILANEYPAAIESVKSVREDTDGYFEYVLETYGGMLVIGAWMYGEPVEVLIDPKTGKAEYCYYEADGTY